MANIAFADVFDKPSAGKNIVSPAVGQGVMLMQKAVPGCCVLETVLFTGIG